MKALRAHDVLPTSPPIVNDPLGLITIPEAARMLLCSKAHVHHIVGGKVPSLPPLPVLRMGRRVLIRRESLLAWVKRVEATEEEIQRASGLFRSSARDLGRGSKG